MYSSCESSDLRQGLFTAHVKLQRLNISINVNKILSLKDFTGVNGDRKFSTLSVHVLLEKKFPQGIFGCLMVLEFLRVMV